jgi:hypothetical protein
MPVKTAVKSRMQHLRLPHIGFSAKGLSKFIGIGSLHTGQWQICQVSGLFKA